MEQLAVSLFDIDRIPPTLRRNLLQGKLELSNIIRILDKPAVVFTCDLLTAALTCDILRSNDRKLCDSPTEVFIKRSKWSRVPSNTVLTVLGPTNKARLNPDVFSVPEERVVLIPPPF